MKNLNLESFGVQEMDAKEMENVDGGGFWAAVAAVGGVYAALYAVGYVAGVGTAYVEKGLKKLNN